MPASGARKRLFPMIEQPNDDQEPVETISKTRHRLPRLRRQVALHGHSPSPAIPANAERLLRSIADAKASRTKAQELINPQHDLT